MVDARHKAQTIAEGIHTPVSFEYANAAARLAAGPFESYDKNKFALQLDTNQIYVLIDTSPIVWSSVSGPGISGDLDMDGYDIIDVGTVDGVDVSAHAGRHEEGGADAIEISDLGTSEINAGLVLKPDGIGGVVWGAGAGAVSTVFTRVGDVVAGIDDYSASQIDNDSTVTGEQVSDALEYLDGYIASVAADVADVATMVVSGDLSGNLPNPSVVDLSITGEEQGSVLYFDGGNWVQLPPGSDGYALITHDTGANPTWEEVASSSPVTSVFGRVGDVIAAVDDYSASQIDNNSTVPGEQVSDALDYLDGYVDHAARHEYGGPDAIEISNLGTSEVNTLLVLQPDGVGGVVWSVAGGGGDVVGPAGATDNAVALFDAGTGKVIKNSLVTIDGSGNISTPGAVDGYSLGSEFYDINAQLDILGGPLGGDLFGTLPNPTVTDLTITAEEQGSVLYFDGANWVQLPPGDDGYALITHDTGANPTWGEVATTAPVTSVFSRVGDVVAATDDYSASQIDNDSTVSGGQVSDALEYLDGYISSHAGDLNNPHQTSIGNIAQGTLAELNLAISDATLDDISGTRTPTSHATSHEEGESDAIDGYQIGINYVPVNYIAPINPIIGEHIAAIDDALALSGLVDSVFGRVGDVVAAIDDYSASQVDNDSTVSGEQVSDALEYLDGYISGHVGDLNNPHQTSVGNIGSGTLAELNLAISDATLDDISGTRTPTAHATSHEEGETDAIDGYQVQLNYVPVNYVAPVNPIIGEHIAAIDDALASSGLVDSVFGRVGDVIAAIDDYSASQIDNDSAVTGGQVSDALEYLDGYIKDHSYSHENGGGDEIEISNLGTSELNNTLVLMPDGIGGVLWSVAGGGGDVVGPAGATNNAIALFDAGTGKVIKNSLVTIDGSGNISTPGTVDGYALGSEFYDINAQLDILTGPLGGDLSGTLPNPTVTDLTITSEEQGSVLYFDGSNWVQLPPGSDGYVLTTHDTGANPTWGEVATTIPVTSVFSRVGDVIAGIDDYSASQIDNDSTVAGEQVSDALEYLDGYVDHAARHEYDGGDPVDGYQIGLVYSPVNYNPPINNIIGEHIAAIDEALASSGLVDSVFGRIGDVIAAVDDYSASQVDNDSAVTGEQVSDALEYLDGYIGSVYTLPVGGDLSGSLPNPEVTDLSITGEEQGSVLYFNGANWVQLPPGQDGYALITHDTGANPTWGDVSVSVPVTSVFGRVGDVVAVTDDYSASEVDNDSIVTGEQVSDALEYLDGYIGSHIVDLNNPHQTSISNIGSGTLAELNLAISDATLDDVSGTRTPTAHAASHEEGETDAIDGYQIGITYVPVNYVAPANPIIGEHIAAIDNALASSGLVDSVFGRIGAVVAVTDDYSASQIDNDSTVPGEQVSDALEYLNNLIELDGYVVGPSFATDDAIALFNGGTGKVIKNSLVTIDGSGNISTPGTVDGYALGSEFYDINAQLDILGGILGGDLLGTLPNPTVVDLTISGEEQGSVLYFDGANWVQLPPGSDGYALITHDTGADPTWGEVATTAPVTSVFTRVGDVVAAVDDYSASQIDNDSTVTGEQVSDALEYLDGYIGDVYSLPVGGDLSGFLPNPLVTDLSITGEEQGSVLYFDGGNWVQLPPGEDGYILTTNGSGANPEWSMEVLKLDQSNPQTIINGQPTVSDGLVFGPTPSVGDFDRGKLYYDELWQTLSLQTGRDVTLQIGQEEWRRVYNDSGSTILNGKAVYTNGVWNGSLPYVATVDLAIANDDAKWQVLGITTQDIPDGYYGFISVRGHVNGVNTSAWTVGDVLYLSDTVAGDLANAEPSPGNYRVRVGRVIRDDAVNGVINVRILSNSKLGDLANVVETSPSLDQVLTFNGVEWVNGNPASSSASPGIDFFNSTPVITARTPPAGLTQAGTAGNGIQINSLSKTPVTTAEQTQTIIASNDTRAGAAWIYDTALGRTSIDAGIWDFTTYASVSNTGGTNTITRTIYQVVPGTGTLSFTGAGANSRTATITAAQYNGTYFVPSGTQTLASFIQATSGTDRGIYQITAMTDPGQLIATATVRTGYTNETGVTYNIWNRLFSVTTVTLTSTSLSQYDTVTSQPAFTIAATDKLGGIMFVTAGGVNRTFTIAYNGTEHNTHVSTPLITLHNNLAGLQGGSANERYHISSAQYTVVGNTSGTNTGDNAANSNYANDYRPSGTDVAVTDGGTGLSAIAAGSILAANMANVLSAVTNTVGTKFLTNAAGTVSWGDVSASLVDNDSTVSGDQISDALEYLDGYVDHATRHEYDGADPVDGYQIGINYVPVNYTTPVNPIIGEHIAAIDQALSTLGLVDSVFGRVGDIVAATDDYSASQIDNDSSVTGEQASDALEYLDGYIGGHVSDFNNPHQTSISNIGSGTLAELNLAISDATLDDISGTRTPTAHATSHEEGETDAIDGYQVGISYVPVNYTAPVNPIIGEHIAAIDEALASAGPVDSVFGRVGDVVSAIDDYAASQIDNDSTVTGEQVSDALEYLDGYIGEVYTLPVGGDLSGTLPNPTVTDLTITSEEQGSVLYFNGSNWVQLPPGDDGYALITHDTGANPTWEAVSGGPGGSGDVVGPASATNNAIARYNESTGKLIQNSGVLVDDSDRITNIVTATFDEWPTLTPDEDGYVTVDFASYQKATIDLNDEASVYITLNEPVGPGNFMLILKQGSAMATTSITWVTEGSHGLYGPYGAISYSKVLDLVTLIGLAYDGNDWFGTSSQPLEQILAG